MPNLNYNVGINDTQVGTQSNKNNLDNDYIISQIKKMIRKNNKISTQKMSIALGTSIRTIKRRIKESNDIQFIGYGSNGYWEIIDDNHKSDDE